MKTWKNIQRLVVVAGIITALAIADGTDATGRELWAAAVITALSLMWVVNGALANEAERRKEEEV